MYLPEVIFNQTITGHYADIEYADWMTEPDSVLTPDFTTAFRLAKLINQNLGFRSARAQDAGTVEVSVPDSYLGNTVELVSFIENLEISPR